MRQLYSPWCHHCEEVEPIYKKLAKVMKSIPSVSVVKMDGVANEHPRAKVSEHHQSHRSFELEIGWRLTDLNCLPASG